MDCLQQVAMFSASELSALDESAHTLFALAEAMDQRDTHTAGHSERLAFLSVNLGIALGLDGSSLRVLYRGGFLHDIGKVGIPDSILFKPGSLTDSEWNTMRSHTTKGESICRHLPSLAPALPVIRHHHERWDGSGYPDGLRGEQIPLLARVLQVADIYDALTNPRPYKRAFSNEEALRILGQETEKGWRDPRIMKTFFRIHESLQSELAESGLNAMRSSLHQLATRTIS
jgi:putative two-component system response regulator